MSRIRYPVVALDVGGVIYYDEPFDLAWAQLAFQQARAADPAFSRDRLLDDMRGFHQGDESSTNVFRSPVGRESWLAVRERWAELAQPIPGAVDGVRSLERGRTICIVANQPPECRDALNAFGLLGEVTLVALDSLVGFAKPDPSLLAWALERLGCSPRDALVVGNRVDHDIAPALELGCEAAFIRADDSWSAPDFVDPEIVAVYRSLRSGGVPPPHPGGARYVVDGLAQVAELLAMKERIGPPTAGDPCR